jgi:hypothetical protein
MMPRKRLWSYFHILQSTVVMISLMCGVHRTAIAAMQSVSVHQGNVTTTVSIDSKSVSVPTSRSQLARVGAPIRVTETGNDRSVDLWASPSFGLQLMGGTMRTVDFSIKLTDSWTGFASGAIHVDRAEHNYVLDFPGYNIGCHFVRVAFTMTLENGTYRLRFQHPNNPSRDVAIASTAPGAAACSTITR